MKENSSISANLNRVLVGSFMIMLFLPVIQMLTQFVSYEEIEKHMNEKRKLASFPPIEKDSLEVFPEKYTSYFQDHFGFRKPLVMTNNYIKAMWFKTSSKDNVIIGKDKWLFFNVKNSARDFEGKVPLNVNELGSLKNQLGQKKHYYDSLGIEFIVLVAPNKMQVYDDMMPDKYLRSDSSRLSQFIDYMKDTGVKIISPLQALRAAKENKLLYQTNDSHWNANAGFIASNILITSLQERFPMLAPSKLEDYEVMQKDKNTGDISGLLGITPFLSNQKFVYTKPSNLVEKQAVSPSYELEYDAAYKATFAFETNLKDHPRLLMFNDSYISYIYPFLSDHFSYSAFYWTHHMNKKIVEAEQPDIVVHLLVERSLDVLMFDLED